MGFTFSNFASQGLEHSMKSWFEKDVNIVNCNASKIHLYIYLLQIVFAVDLLIHLTSDQVCPNPPESEREIVTSVDFYFGQFNLIGN